MKKLQKLGNLIDLDELKIIQLDILSVIDKFCRSKGIKYSLGCGSMLGAARHKGYIPWDDDIDIYLLREEYEKLIKQFPNSFDNIKIASLQRDSQWNRAYSKAYDSRTVMIDAGDKSKIGVGIDIFPIDTVPEDQEEWTKYDNRRRRYQRIYEWKTSMLTRKGREWWKYLMLPFTKFFLLPFSTRKIAIFLERYSMRYRNTESSLVFECCQGIYQKRPFKRSALENIIDMPFEDRVFCGMRDYDEYLSNAYGDWRKLPPEEKRVSHHIFKAWWK